MRNNHKLALSVAAATLAVAGAASAPQALAGSVAQHHAEVDAMSRKVEMLESQLQAMQSELESLRSQSSHSSYSSSSSADSAKVQELEAWMNSVKASRSLASVKHDNTIFFRGGYARMDELRNGVSIQSDVVPLGAQDQADQDAWYIGAGFDFGLTDDVWGMMANTEVLAELMFEYKHFGNAQGNCLASDPTCLAALVGGAGGPAREVTVNQFTLTASPKIKFMKGSPIRPWLIPVGLGIHVISPPSESITVLDPGVMFAGGVDYRLWKDIFIGVDARYHVTGGDSDGVNTNGFTAGGYLGIGF